MYSYSMTLPCSLSSPPQPIPPQATVQSLSAILAQIGARLTLVVRDRLSASTTNSSRRAHNHRRHRREQQRSIMTTLSQCSPATPAHALSRTSLQPLLQSSNAIAQRRRRRFTARRALSKAVLHSAPTNTRISATRPSNGVRRFRRSARTPTATVQHPAAVSIAFVSNNSPSPPSHGEISESCLQTGAACCNHSRYPSVRSSSRRRAFLTISVQIATKQSL